jgi:hypothetical protein
MSGTWRARPEQAPGHQLIPAGLRSNPAPAPSQGCPGSLIFSQSCLVGDWDQPITRPNPLIAAPHSLTIFFTQGRFVGVGQMQDEVKGADHYRKSASRYAELAKTAQDPVLRDIYLETVRYMMLRAAGPAAQS